MVIPKDGFLYKVNRVSRADKNTSNNDDHQQNFFTGDGIEDFEVDINKLIGWTNYWRPTDIFHRGQGE